MIDKQKPWVKQMGNHCAHPSGQTRIDTIDTPESLSAAFWGLQETICKEGKAVRNHLDLETKAGLQLALRRDNNGYVSMPTSIENPSSASYVFRIPKDDSSDVWMYKVVEGWQEPGHLLRKAVYILAGTVPRDAVIVDGVSGEPIPWENLVEDIRACEYDAVRRPVYPKIAVSLFTPRELYIEGIPVQNVPEEARLVRLGHVVLRPLLASLSNAKSSVLRFRYEIGQPCIEPSTGKRTSEYVSNCVCGIHVHTSLAYALAMAYERMVCADMVLNNGNVFASRTGVLDRASQKLQLNKNCLHIRYTSRRWAKTMRNWHEKQPETSATGAEETKERDQDGSRRRRETVSPCTDELFSNRVRK